MHIEETIKIEAFSRKNKKSRLIDEILQKLEKRESLIVLKLNRLGKYIIDDY